MKADEPAGGSENRGVQISEWADVETASEDYARRFDGDIGRYFLEIQAEATLDLIAPWRGGRVLDVGGGHAQIAVPLVQNGFRVTVVGSHTSCENRLARFLSPDSYSFHRCDLLHLPFEDGAFDVVVAFRLLPHVQPWQSLIREMCRVAKEAIIVDYPDVRSLNFAQKAFFRWKKAIERNTRPFRCFRRVELVREFSKHQFGRMSVRPELFLPMVVHRALKSVSFSRTAEGLCRFLGLQKWFGSPVVLRVISDTAWPRGTEMRSPER